MIKDKDGQPDKETNRERPGRVLSAGASVPIEFRCVTLPVCGCVHDLEAPEPHTIGVFMESFSCRHDRLLTVHPAPIPSLENWGWG